MKSAKRQREDCLKRIMIEVSLMFIKKRLVIQIKNPKLRARGTRIQVSN